MLDDEVASRDFEACRAGEDPGMGTFIGCLPKAAQPTLLKDAPQCGYNITLEGLSPQRADGGTTVGRDTQQFQKQGMTTSYLLANS
jgi:hypothetical protein